MTVTGIRASDPARTKKEAARRPPLSLFHRFMLAPIAGVIETAGLQIGPGDRDFGNCRLRQNLGGNIVDRSIGDFMNEADVLVFAGYDAGDDFAPGDFGIDNGLAPAPSIVDHDHEILHKGTLFASRTRACDVTSISENQKLVK
jgi:hypothetical protein